MTQAMAARAQGGVSRAHRDLSGLRTTASSWRTLNLIRVWERFRGRDGYRDNPFFKHPALNRSIILKHRLRPYEADAFDSGRRVATKVILPINIQDLRSGARTFFVGQRAYRGVCAEIGLMQADFQADLDLLDLLDRISSLDPFILRERLGAAGFMPAPCYFEINEVDARRMDALTRKEISPLIGLALDSGGVRYGESVGRLAGKLLRNAGDVELEPLRLSLGLEPAAFVEGVFAWRGFIYYKWALADAAARIPLVAAEIARARPARRVAPGEREVIALARSRAADGLTTAATAAREALRVYEAAYGELTEYGRPAAFRDFLLSASPLFNALGDRMGIIQHVLSYWRYRHPPGSDARLDASELVDVLREFDYSLSSLDGDRGGEADARFAA